MRLIYLVAMLAVAWSALGCSNEGSDNPDPNDPNIKRNIGKPGLVGPGAGGDAESGAAK